MVTLAVIAVVVTLLTIAIVEFGIPKLVITLGEIDTWWSPFQTLPPPGEMYILVRGSKSGPFAKLIHSVLDRDFDETTHEFSQEILEDRGQDSEYLASLGVAWVGFFRYLFYREVRHDKWEKNPKTSEWGMESKVRPGPSIYFRYNMAVQIKGAETVGNFPVDGIVVFTAQLMNPVKAFFFAGGWETQTTAAVSGRFRKYVSDKTIDQLREEHTKGGQTLVDEIKSLGEPGNGSSDQRGLHELFGVQIIDARFVLFDLVGGDAEMNRAVKALELEKLNAAAAAERGKGDRDERLARSEGVRAEVAAWGSHPVGGQVAMAEAIKVAKPNVLGGGFVTSIESERKEKE